MATLPTYTLTIDNAATQTWHRLSSMVEDQILEATPGWAWLKMKGCLKTQEGGELISEQVTYDLEDTQDIAKGTVLNMGETETDTAAIFDFRNIGIHVQRTLLDDIANRGPDKLVDYVARKLQRAQDGLKQTFETRLWSAHRTDEGAPTVGAPKQMQSFNDLVPPSATRATGTYGRIARPTNFTSNVPDAGNTWWTPRYKQFTANKEVNLITDMDSFYNTVGNQQENVDGIFGPKEMYELYTAFGLDQVQLLNNTKMLQLGFDNARYRGADFMWTPNMTGGTGGDLLFLNSRRIDVKYDPAAWFTMTPWQQQPRQLERLAWIICRCNMMTFQPRRHGRLYT